jgi:hypothetical protein
MTGYIQKKLFVAMRRLQEIMLQPEGTIVNVLPAFIVPEDNIKLVNRANIWKRQYDYVSRAEVDGTSTVIPNVPVSGVRIVGLSKRQGGGIAYKIIYPPNYLVDMREGVLLDAIYNVGIGTGGILNGQYIWSLNSSQVRLIRTESKLYKELLRLDGINNFKKISIKDLKPGSIYVAKSGPSALFVGFVSTIFMKPIWGHNNNHLGYYNRTLSCIESYKRKSMLWFKANGSSVEEISERFARYIDNTQDINSDYSHISVESSHSMRKEIGSINLPEDVIYVTRNIVRNKVMEQLVRSNLSPNSETYEVNVLCNNSPILNMVPYGEDPLENMFPVYKRILGL